MKNLLILLAAMVVILSISCAPMHEKAFLKESDDNNRVFNQKLEVVQRAVMATLADYGYKIEEVDASKDPLMIKARKIIRSGEKSDMLSLCCYLFADNEKTRVTVAAEEEISDTNYKLKVFWLIFIPIPYGREPRREVIEKGTISDPEFFAIFFGKLSQNLPPAKPL